MSGSGLILRLRMDPLVCSRLTRGKLLSCIPQDMVETGLEADGIHRGQLPNAILHMLHLPGLAHSAQLRHPAKHPADSEVGLRKWQ